MREPKVLLEGKNWTVLRSSIWRASAAAQATQALMAVYRPDTPPYVAEIIRHLPPDLKRSIAQLIRKLSLNPYDGAPLLRELAGLRKYKVRTVKTAIQKSLNLLKSGSHWLLPVGLNDD